MLRRSLVVLLAVIGACSSGDSPEPEPGIPAELSRDSLGWVSARGNTFPLRDSVTVSAATGQLDSAAVAVEYASGSISAWLTVWLDQAREPALLSLEAGMPGVLDIGTHTAHVVVAVPGQEDLRLRVDLQVVTPAVVTFVSGDEIVFGRTPGSGSVEGGGMRCLLIARDCAIPVVPGATITAVAVSDPWSYFEFWSENACATPGAAFICTFTILGDTTIGVRFSMQGTNYTVAMEGAGANGVVDGSIAVEGAPFLHCVLTSGVQSGLCSEYQTYGTRSQVLTAQAGAGSTFLRWEGDCAGTFPTCTLTPNPAAVRFARAIFAGP